MATLSAAPDRNAHQKLQTLKKEMDALLKKHDLTAADAVAQKILALELPESTYQTVIRAFSTKKMYGSAYTKKYYEQAMGDKALSIYGKALCKHYYGTVLMHTSLDEKDAYKFLYAPFTESGLTLKQRADALGATRGTFQQKAFLSEHEKIYRMFLDMIKKDKNADEKERNAAVSRLLSWRLGMLRHSPEATQKFCTEAMKNPLFASQKLTLICAKAESYVGRAEAEAAADALEKEITADMSPQDKTKIYNSMMNLYTDAAKRYYLPENPAVLKKKLDTVRKMIAIPPERVKNHMDMLLLADAVGDKKTAAETLERLKNWNGAQKENARAFACAYQAAKAYEAGNYAQASEFCDQALSAKSQVYYYGDPKLLDMAVRSAAALRKYDKALSYEPRVQKVARQSRRLLDEMSVLKNRLGKTEK